MLSLSPCIPLVSLWKDLGFPLEAFRVQSALCLLFDVSHCNSVRCNFGAALCRHPERESQKFLVLFKLLDLLFLKANRGRNTKSRVHAMRFQVSVSFVQHHSRYPGFFFLLRGFSNFPVNCRIDPLGVLSHLFENQKLCIQHSLDLPCSD